MRVHDYHIMSAPTHHHGFDPRIPITAGTEGMGATAWIDTDVVEDEPRFHVVLQIAGRDEIDLFGLKTHELKAIATALSELCDKLSNSQT